MKDLPLLRSELRVKVQFGVPLVRVGDRLIEGSMPELTIHSKLKEIGAQLATAALHKVVHLYREPNLSSHH